LIHAGRAQPVVGGRKPLTPALALGALDRVGAQLDRPLVGARGAGIVARAARQLGVRRVQWLIALQAGSDRWTPQTAKGGRRPQPQLAVGAGVRGPQAASSCP
jgi:hypothetical protein